MQRVRSVVRLDSPAAEAERDPDDGAGEQAHAGPDDGVHDERDGHTAEDHHP